MPRLLPMAYALSLLALLLAGCGPLPATPATPTDTPLPAPAGVDLLPAAAPPGDLLISDWRTDFDRRTVPWPEIRSGGPPKDGIPAVDDPAFESVTDAAAWLSERDPLIVFTHNGETRGYPLAILIWHEIVNDTVGGAPVSITFCPLCNASIVFDRTFHGQVLDFGATGLLRHSDLVMYDRQSESWWQQATGQAIVGQWAGERLTFLPSQVISFGGFAAAFPSAQVLARPALPRSYGSNPYTGYDSPEGRPFLYEGKLDTRLPAMERVVGLELGGNARAYPFALLAEVGALDDTLGGQPIVVLHKSGTASALDSRIIGEGRDVGSSAVFLRRVDGQELTLRAAEDGRFVDAETGTIWNLLGQAEEGPLAGQQLEPVLAFDHFWFAWSAFFPQTEIYGEDGSTR